MNDHLLIPNGYPGDPNWVKAHGELVELHIEKSSTYGTDDDRFANFTAPSLILKQPPERAVLARIVEKATRAINMLDAGLAADVQEYPDMSSLALIAEALRRRRL